MADKVSHDVMPPAPAASSPVSVSERFTSLLATVASGLDRMSADQRLDRLFALISPLLDEIAQENRHFLDYPQMETAEAVNRFRRIAAGECLDADAVHYHLTHFAWGESEEPDRQMHVRSQSAWLAAEWLQLKVGRRLHVPDHLGEYDSGDSATFANALAWTRSRQVCTRPEHVSDSSNLDGRDVRAAGDVLADILEELAD